MVNILTFGPFGKTIQECLASTFWHSSSKFQVDIAENELAVAVFVNRYTKTLNINYLSFYSGVKKKRNLVAQNAKNSLI